MWKLGIHCDSDYQVVQKEVTADASGDQDLECSWKTREKRWHSHGSVVLCIILLTNVLTASISFFLLGCGMKSAGCRCPGDVQPASKCHKYREDLTSNNMQAHWMSEVDYSLHSSTFLPWTASPTQYSADTADLGDSVDDAWKDLGVYYRLILLPEQYASAYNVSAEQHWLVTPEENENAPYAGFPVNIEALRHLHCINFLRQGLYYNYDFYRSNPSYFFSDGTEQEVRTHLAHCVDALRQLVMCWSDTDVLPILRPTDPEDKPHITDFTRVKQCKNFESLRMWVEERQWAGAANVAPKHGD
ncbi:hypothetical protein HII31_10830 [Pseudocercospora fuligena]|uniref:Cyclochlorotine biosynthesis protein O n=1 Tax=Pseudocercospora fuligena TaxID=685502 RepID=A0A8H6VE36_9PEZI|nr:hypothetical protein HII31_10830 [Pseudocercospora fuligena]